MMCKKHDEGDDRNDRQPDLDGRRSEQATHDWNNNLEELNQAQRNQHLDLNRSSQYIIDSIKNFVLENDKE